MGKGKVNGYDQTRVSWEDASFKGDSVKYTVSKVSRGQALVFYKKG